MDEGDDRIGGRGEDPPPGRAAAADQARGRVDAMFEGFNRLTPTELAHIGLERSGPDERLRRRSLLDAVEAAARAAGREALLWEARAEARDVVLRRYAEGGLNPTWVALNWGVSEGTAGDRAAIVQALTDAAAAAVVADLVAPEVVDDLSVDAEHVLALAAGDAYEGALSRAIEPPAPGLDDPPGRRLVVYGGALIGGLLVATSGAAMLAPPIGVAGGLVFALIVIAQARRPPGERPGPASGEMPGPGA